MTHQAVSSFLNLLSQFLLVSFRFLVGQKYNLYIITYISVTKGKAKWLIHAAHFSNHPLSNFLPPSPINFFRVILWFIQKVVHFHDLTVTKLSNARRNLDFSGSVPVKTLFMGQYLLWYN